MIQNQRNSHSFSEESNHQKLDHWLGVPRETREYKADRPLINSSPNVGERKTSKLRPRMTDFLTPGYTADALSGPHLLQIVNACGQVNLDVKKQIHSLARANKQIREELYNCYIQFLEQNNQLLRTTIERSAERLDPHSEANLELGTTLNDAAIPTQQHLKEFQFLSQHIQDFIDQKSDAQQGLFWANFCFIINKKSTPRTPVSFSQRNYMHASSDNNIQDSTDLDGPLIEEFLDLYSWRVCLFYLFRARFLVKLFAALKKTLDLSALMNPISTLDKIFKRGSALNLTSPALSVHLYSWYRPSAQVATALQLFLEHLTHLSQHDLVRLSQTVAPKDISQDYHDFSEQTAEDSSTLSKALWTNFEGFLESQRPQNELLGLKYAATIPFSHAISHRSFGLFLSDLFINIPRWLSPAKKEHAFSSLFHERPSYNPHSSMPTPIPCLITGDYVESCSMAYWLGQQQNNDNLWDQILCPDIIDQHFQNGKSQFNSYCHELLFLSFLTEIAEVQKHNPINLIAVICRQKYQHYHDSLCAYPPRSGQLDLFHTSENKDHFKQFSPSYERMFINIGQLPKTNQHHYVLQKVLEQSSSLNKGGLIFLLTSQKFFVPSHSERIQGLLCEFKLEMIVDFNQLKGKGEVPGFLYVLRKRQKKLSISEITPLTEWFFHFHWRGELGQFQHIDPLLDEWKNFFESIESRDAPIYFKQILENLNFEYHRDAVSEGKILTSAAKNQNKITHPRFFQNIAKKCIGLDQLFHIETLQFPQASQQNHQEDPNIFLGLPLSQGPRSNNTHASNWPYLLIVDFSRHEQTQIDVVPMNNFMAKWNQQGLAEYSYFALLPKVKGLDIDILRGFYQTSVGQQILQIGLPGPSSKIKSKVRSLLIPQFFGDAILPSSVERHLSQEWEKMEDQSIDLIESSHEEIIDWANSRGEWSQKRKTTSPYLCFAALCRTMFTVRETMFDLHLVESKTSIPVRTDEKNWNAIFQHPAVYGDLIHRPLYQLMPKHPEVFLKLSPNFYQVSHAPTKLIQLKVSTFDHSASELVFLDHKHEAACIIVGEAPLLRFIHFLASQLQHLPLVDLLKGLKSPKNADLLQSISKFDTETEIFWQVEEQFRQQCEQLIGQYILA